MCTHHWNGLHFKEVGYLAKGMYHQYSTFPVNLTLMYIPPPEYPKIQIPYPRDTLTPDTYLHVPTPGYPTPRKDMEHGRRKEPGTRDILVKTFCLPWDSPDLLDPQLKPYMYLRKSLNWQITIVTSSKWWILAIIQLQFLSIKSIPNPHKSWHSKWISESDQRAKNTLCWEWNH